MPGEDHVKRIGLFNNERNKYHDSKTTQRQLNRFAANVGNYPTQEGYWHPLTFLFYLSLLNHSDLSGMERPEGHRAVRESNAAFEADTFMESGPWERNLNQTVIHSLRFHSTINRTRIEPELMGNTTTISNNIHANATLASPVSMTDFVHFWTLGIHKVIYRLKELENCTTTKTETPILEWGLWEKPNHTRTHFKTVCQTAVEKSQKVNQSSFTKNEEIQQFYFKNSHSEIPVAARKIQEKAEQLSRMVQDSFKESQNPTLNVEPRMINYTENPTNHSSLEGFWEGLTETFHSFFQQHEALFHFNSQESNRATTLLDDFWSVMTKVFSVTSPESVITEKQTKKEEVLTYVAQTLSKDESKQAGFLQETEASIAAPLLELVNDMYERVNVLFERINFKVFPGAEARTLSRTTAIPEILPYESSSELPLKGVETLSEEMLANIHRMLTAYSQGQPLLSLLPQPTLPFWYDYALFQKMDLTKVANDRIRDAISKQFSELSNYNTKSTKEFFRILQEWGTQREGNEDVLEKRRQLARIILKAYELKVEDFSDERAVLIFLQWRNNNVFMKHTFIQQVAPTQVAPIQTTPQKRTRNERTETTTPIPTLLPYDDQPNFPLKSSEELSSDVLSIFNRVRTAYMKIQTVPVLNYQPISPFWYDLELFQKRNQTREANHQIRDAACKLYRDLCVANTLSTKQFIGVVQAWGTHGEGKVDILEKRRQFARLILRAYDLNDAIVSDSQAILIFLQWRNNNAFLQYTFQKIATTHVGAEKKQHELDILPYDVSSEVPLKSLKPLSEETNAALDQLLASYNEDLISPVKTPGEWAPVWYDLEVFQQRNHTGKAISMIKNKVCDLSGELCLIDDSSIKGLFKAIQRWANQGANIHEVLTKRRQIAKIILQAYDLEWTVVSDNRAIAIFLQWRNNEIFKDITFREIPTSFELPIPVLPYNENPKVKLQSEEDISEETGKILGELVELYRENKLSLEKIDGPLEEVWYDYAVFQKREKTEAANDKINTEVCAQYNELCLFDEVNTSGVIFAIQEWGNQGSTNEAILENRKAVARIILKAYDLPEMYLTDVRAIAIFLQWRMNNLLKGVEFKKTNVLSWDVKQASQSTSPTPPLVTRKSERSLKLPLKMTENMHPAVYIDVKYAITGYLKDISRSEVGVTSPTPSPALKRVLPFWYDLPVFEQRKETEKVNENVLNYLCNQQGFQWCVFQKSEKDIQLLFITLNRLESEQTVTNSLGRRRALAGVILKTLGLADSTLTDDRANAIFLQWRNNNIFKAVDFEEPHPPKVKKQANGEIRPTIPKINIEEVEASMNIPLQTNEGVSEEMTDSISHAILYYMNHKVLVGPLYGKRQPFWFDQPVFERRGEINKVNEAVLKYICEQNMDWCQFTNESIHEFIKDWQLLENEDSITQRTTRRRAVARVILQSLDLPYQGISGTRANAVFLQWRNNNVFKGSDFENIKSTTKTQVKVTQSSQSVTPSSGDIPSEVALVNQIAKDLEQNRVPQDGYHQELPIVFFEKTLYLKRDETGNVNQQLTEFFHREGTPIPVDGKDKLAVALQKWLNEGKGEAANRLARENFIIYFILNAYKIEIFRLGDVLTTIQFEMIYKQWLMNTLLEGATYKKLTPQTVQYKLSSIQESLDEYFPEIKKINDQIFADYMNGHLATIPKNNPISPYIYHQSLFDNRDKTTAVNEALKAFLLEHNVSFDFFSARDLVQTVRDWSFQANNYEDFVKRQLTLAKTILENCGIAIIGLTIREARTILLQWENNNAQKDYTYKRIAENSHDHAVDSTIDIQQIKGKIERFFRINKFGNHTEPANAQLKKQQPVSLQDSKTQIRQRLSDFLTKKGVVWNTSDPNELVIKVAKWAVIEGKTPETLDKDKLKELALVIKGKKSGEVIEEEEAHQTVVKWVVDSFEIAPPSSEQVTEAAAHVTVTQENVIDDPNQMTHEMAWQNKEIMKQVEYFFRQKGLLSEQPSKEDIWVAMGKYFTQEGVGMVFMSDKVQPLAAVILKELNLYGGLIEEKISDKLAESTIMKWVIHNILGSSIEVYAVKNILSAFDPSNFTIGDLRKLFEIEHLEKNQYIHLTKFKIDFKDAKETHNQENKMIIQKLWVNMIKRVLPNYFLETSQLADELLISDYGSLMQLTGANFLQDIGLSTEFDRTEIRALGEFLYETVVERGIRTLQELNYLLIPALLTTAQLDPEGLLKAVEQDSYKEFALGNFIGYGRSSYFKIYEQEQILNARYRAYQTGVVSWRHKQALVEDVMQECVKRGLVNTIGGAETYLLGGEPCPDQWKPPKLEHWYQQLTRIVSNTYFSLNQKNLELALQSMQPQEYQFLFSKHTCLYEAKAQLKHEVRYHTPAGPGIMPPVFFGGKETWLDTILNLERTNLIVAIRNNEERWYAIKKLEAEGGFVVYRVDKNPLLYLKYGLLDNEEIWREQYQQEGEKIRIGQKLYTFSSEVHRNKKINYQGELIRLSEVISRKHSDLLYKQLYELGDDKSITEKVWDALKHFIPFYDCIVGIIEQDASTAVPACVIDTILLIPVLGQITAFNAKFALGMAKSLATGGLKGAIKNGVYLLPTRAEIKLLLTSVGRFVDPGFELVTGGGKAVWKGLVNLKNRESVSSEIKLILSKLESFDKAPTHLADALTLAYLPGNGPEVYVKHVKDKLYMRVLDLEQGDVFGEYFTLRGEELRVFEGPASFTSEQKALISRLARKVDTSVFYVEEKNHNPWAYGEGTVLSVVEKKQSTEHHILMNGLPVPIRVQEIEHIGVRYDVIEGDNIYPINFNGIEWYFEPATSFSISNEVAEEVSKQLDAFEFLNNPNTLSPPDEHGLMWNSLGRSYIKINNRYFPFVLLYEEENIYHLVKKDPLERLLLLRLHSGDGVFRLDDTWGGLSSYSSLESYLNNLQEDLEQAILLPPSAGRDNGWNKVRQAEIVPTNYHDPILTEGGTTLQALSAFFPELPNYIYKDDHLMRRSILASIKRYLPRDRAYDFRVFVGFDSSKSPDFMKPFQKKLAEDLIEAKENFKYVKNTCVDLLSVSSIGKTDIGKNLIQLFGLESLPKQEKVLQEILKRVVSVSVKGELFIQQSIDWGFDNIWIVSTDLVFDEATKKYYSKLKKGASADAFVIKADQEARIIIMADNFHLSPDINLEYELDAPPKLTLTHEITHHVAQSIDLVVYERPKKGFQKSAKELIEQFMKKYPDDILVEDFNKFVFALAKSLGQSDLSQKTVLDALKVDPILFVNFLMSDAELLSFLIRDIAEGRKYAQKVPAKRSADDLSLSKGLMSMFLSINHMGNYLSISKNPQLAKSQERSDMTTRKPSTDTTKNHRKKRSLSTLIQTCKNTSDAVNQNLFYSQTTKKSKSMSMLV